MTTQGRYAGLLRRLMPSGFAWTQERGSRLQRLLGGMADELARVEEHATEVLRESDPRTAAETIADWEEAVGLPDPCAGPIEDLDGRRGAVVARLIQNGGQTPAFFVQLAAALGYSITVREFTPWGAGDRLPGRLCQPGRPFRSGSSGAGDRLDNDQRWLFAWRVDAFDFATRRARAGSMGAGDRLATFGNLVLQCTLQRLKPAQTIVSFRYALPIPIDPAAADSSAPPLDLLQLGLPEED